MKISLLISGASETLPARIAAKVKRLACGCHQWTGAARRRRDGVLRPAVRVGGRGSRFVTVARVVLALKDGYPLAMRDTLEAGHTCGHYWCVNSDHLVWQTRLENEREKQERCSDAETTTYVDRLVSGVNYLST